jgi:AcrR family transcriptional regulator
VSEKARRLRVTTASPPRLQSAAPARPRRTQAERTALSDARLLDAALRQIAASGYRASSLHAIAQEAGYSPGLVSHRFGSKRGMVRALVEHVRARWDELRIAALQAENGDSVRAMVRAHRQSLREHPDAVRALYRMMFESHGELAELRGDFAASDRRARAQSEALLRADQKRGRLRDDLDPEVMSTIGHALLRGVVIHWMLDPESIDLDRTYAEIERGLTSWLAPDAEQSSAPRAKAARTAEKGTRKPRARSR